MAPSTVLRVCENFQRGFARWTLAGKSQRNPKYPLEIEPLGHGLGSVGWLAAGVYYSDSNSSKRFRAGSSARSGTDGLGLRAQSVALLREAEAATTGDVLGVERRSDQTSELHRGARKVEAERCQHRCEFVPKNRVGDLCEDQNREDREDEAIRNPIDVAMLQLVLLNTAMG